MKKLFVGSLPWSVNDQQLGEIFAEVGTVESANVVLDKMTGRSRGFGFVEMSSVEEAQKAVEVLNGKEVDGRTIIVSEAKPQVDRR
jgi:RNA recognition motif-containing protein